MPRLRAEAGVEALERLLAVRAERRQVVAHAHARAHGVRAEDLNRDGAGAQLRGGARVADARGIVIDHDPRRLVRAVGCHEDRSGTLTALRIRIARLPALRPAALALGREQRHSLLARQLHGDLEALRRRDRVIGS